MSTLLEKEFGVFVFSYNRGPHLDVCLRSVVDNAPARFVRVYDDGSDDPETIETLQRWESRVDVHRAEPSTRSVHGRGGLHANMEQAFAFARDAEVPYALMLQDDMQVVRRIDQVDLDGWRSFFAATTNSLELNVSFDFHDEVSPSEWHMDASVAFLPIYPTRSDSYDAAGLFHVGRYWKFLGALKATEYANTEWLFAQGLVTGRSKTPFTMFTPYPRTARTRGLRKWVKARLAERIANAGVHPFSYMTEQEVARLRQTRLDAPPLARQWLSCPTMDHRETWSYFGGPRDLRACGGLRAVLGTLLGGKAPLHSRLRAQEPAPEVEA